MTWFRYLGLSVIKWITVFFFISVFTAYLTPEWLTGYWLALPIWIVIALMGFGFARWAFHITLPGKPEVISLIVIWMAVTICLQIFYELMTLGSVVFLLKSPDLYVQYLLEIIAIIIAARVTRKQKIEQVTGTGMAV